jgi:ubiquinone/menaquinone biosynthesis C-methylase UbiE
MQLEGYISIDKFDKTSDICMDVQDLNITENSVEEIFASHLLEHLNPHYIESTLGNWLKVLKPGGSLVLELPNLEGLCKLFLDGNNDERRNITMYIYGTMNTTGTGDTRTITSSHLWGYYPNALKEILTNVGFVNIEIKEQQFIHPGSNFRVEAKKGAG